MAHTFKKVPSIHPTFWKRKIRKGKYIPKIKSFYSSQINFRRKQENKEAKRININKL